MKIRNFIFDSNSDYWNFKTPSFDEAIIYKSNLIFIIEDEKENKFGGYINAKIDRYEEHINDTKSFVFSLKSDRRSNGMIKFDVLDSQYAFILFHQSDDSLFAIGGGYDILICKKDNKINSYCRQCSFNYKRFENAFCGKSYLNTFTPKRITAIQLK